jgi:hypothetical protein
MESLAGRNGGMAEGLEFGFKVGEIRDLIGDLVCGLGSLNTM